jgi:phenylalanyl-tRNA synthetase beta chain
MKFSWNWLNDHVDLTGIDPAEVAGRLTLTVAEVEGVETIGAGLRDVLVAGIVSVEQHPNADKLKVVEVDLGDRHVSGVSGAPNLRQGMLVPVALPGATLPGGVIVREAELRGVPSRVVLLSEREMGLSDDHSGVMELPDGTTLGDVLVDVLPIQDTVFEVDNKSITHRPDLWGHRGLAREIAAMTGRELKPFDTSIPRCSDDPLAVSVDDPADCPRYMALCFDGVQVAPSPLWLRRRLRAVGLRPISNVVDATNFVMLDLGEPTHAFDRRQVRGDAIRVRRAGEDDSFRTLDGQDHRLSSEDLLIADGERGVALAGVMGGANSEIADDTTSVVLEAATFHPGRVRRTSVRHGIRTDSSARFEKSLDPNLPPMATALFARLLTAMCPTVRVASRVYDVAGFDNTPLRIDLDPEYIRRRLGAEVPDERIRSILTGLGFAIQTRPDGVFDVTVPSHRATRDVSIPEDLLEEIGRVIGYDQVPPTPPLAAVTLVPRRPRRDAIRRIKALLTAECGLDEIQTYSFDSQALLQRIGYIPEDPISVRNPISSDFATLRTDLMPNLLGAVERNAQRFQDFGLFEIGRVFHGSHDADGTPRQPVHLALALYRRAARTPADIESLFRQARGIVEHLLDRLEVASPVLDAGLAAMDRPWLQARAALRIMASGQELGMLSRVHPAVLRALDVPGAAIIADIDVDALTAAPRGHRRFSPVPRFPSIQSDLSMVIGDEVAAQALFDAVRAGGGELLASVELIAIYAGAPIPEGRRSLTFRMTFQSTDRTLEDTEVRQAVERIGREVRAAGAAIWGDNETVAHDSGPDAP